MSGAGDGADRSPARATVADVPDVADDGADPRPQRQLAPEHAHLEEARARGGYVFHGALLHVRRDTVRLPDGKSAVREYVVHSGAVLVVPVLPDGALIVERQFRYPMNRAFLEFPAGKIDPGETPLDTAVRELREEAGYTAGRYAHMGVVHPVISYSTERIEMFVAHDLVHVGRRLDDGEFLDIVPMRVDAMLAALDAGEITDAKTVAALLLYVRKFAR